MCMSTQITGCYKAIVQRPDGSEKFNSGWQNNLMLDAGLEYFGLSGNSILNYLHIGRGNSQPNTSQTSLDIPTASAYGINNPSKKDNYVANKPFYVSTTQTYRFNRGVGGNVTELGLSPSRHLNQGVKTRALIKDSNGNPTSISILSDEYLIIYYELRLYFPEIEKVHTSTATINLNGTDKTFNIRVQAFNVGSYYFSRGLSIGGEGDPFNHYNHLASSGGGNINISSQGLPASFQHQIDIRDMHRKAGYPRLHGYTAGSYERKMSIFLPRGENLANIRTIYLHTNKGSWVVEFTDPDTGEGIKKTADEQLSLVFKASWGRYTGVVE